MVLMWCFINVHVFQQQEQVLSDLVDGKEIYNTIRRKTKDAFYKNIVKKGYLLFNKGTHMFLHSNVYKCNLPDRSPFLSLSLFPEVVTGILPLVDLKSKDWCKKYDVNSPLNLRGSEQVHADGRESDSCLLPSPLPTPRQRQAVEEPLLHLGGERRPAHLL